MPWEPSPSQAQPSGEDAAEDQPYEGIATAAVPSRSDLSRSLLPRAWRVFVSAISQATAGHGRGGAGLNAYLATRFNSPHLFKVWRVEGTALSNTDAILLLHR